MRLLTYRVGGNTRVGRLDGDQVTDLGAGDVGRYLADHRDWRARAAAADGAARSAADLDLAPLVPRPGKIICLGLNYRGHIAELGRETPQHPAIFAKFACSLVGGRDPIEAPPVSDQLDWEAELAFVIGSPIRNATPEEAKRAIAGYAVLNDISLREWQWRTPQWLQGKTWEHTTPFGPALVSGDEVDDAVDLEVRCEVDGEMVQSGRTSELIFRPVDVAVFLSQIMTLEPGDVVSTGTPAGVGSAKTPPRFLKPGNVVRTSVEGLGECVNVVVESPREAG
jgi:acylpyruvate hydrolase